MRLSLDLPLSVYFKTASDPVQFGCLLPCTIPTPVSNYAQSLGYNSFNGTKARSGNSSCYHPSEYWSSADIQSLVLALFSNVVPTPTPIPIPTNAPIYAHTHAYICCQHVIHMHVSLSLSLSPIDSYVYLINTYILFSCSLSNLLILMCI